jgi:hypothetical protein
MFLVKIHLERLQGDALSCSLFLLAIVPVLLNILSNNMIQVLFTVIGSDSHGLRYWDMQTLAKIQKYVIRLVQFQLQFHFIRDFCNYKIPL